MAAKLKPGALGIAFVEYETVEDATRAMQTLDGYTTTPGARGIRIEYAQHSMGTPSAKKGFLPPQ
eukprot:GAFH01003308.1.p5 GENE.GAFH01003308.1~~GAFH01003308.1.p5  ORF type:complete len:65 (-),score=17.86 GAFH01003308.1:134-328(-)